MAGVYVPFLNGLIWDVVKMILGDLSLKTLTRVAQVDRRARALVRKLPRYDAFHKVSLAVRLKKPSFINYNAIHQPKNYTLLPACKSNQVEIVQWFEEKLRTSAHLEISREDWDHLCLNGQTEMAIYLFEQFHFARQNYGIPDRMRNDGYHFYLTLIREICLGGKVKMIEFMLRQVKRLHGLHNCGADDYFTWVCRSGQVEAAKLFLSQIDPMKSFVTFGPDKRNQAIRMEQWEMHAWLCEQALILGESPLNFLADLYLLIDLCIDGKLAVFQRMIQEKQAAKVPLDLDDQDNALFKMCVRHQQLEMARLVYSLVPPIPLLTADLECFNQACLNNDLLMIQQLCEWEPRLKPLPVPKKTHPRILAYLDS